MFHLLEIPQPPSSRLRWLLVLGMWCLALADMSRVSAQDWDLVLVDIDARQATLVEVFDYLEQETDYRFRYGESVMEHLTPYTLRYSRARLRVILEDLAQQAGLRLVARNQTISVILKDRLTPQLVQAASTTLAEGRVYDAETGAPLEGVALLVKGEQVGTFTDAQGRFTLQTKEEAPILVASYLGYAPVEIPLSSQGKLAISLAPDYSDLEEVVIIGYGEQSRLNVTGAISKIDAREFDRYAASGVDQKLIGTLAGVQINQVNGQPGSDAQVIIRGLGTLTAGSNPLIVVDGVPLAEGSSINSISPGTIESVTVLKDAASAAIYGSRASNGVILITTHSGCQGPLRITADLYSGLQTRADQVALADAYASAQFFTEARDWGYVSRDPINRSAYDDEATRLAHGANKRELRLDYLQPYLDGTPGLPQTDWLDLIFREAPMTNAKLSLSGGSKEGSYLVTADYFNQQGVALGTGFERLSGSIKLSSQLFPRVRFDLSLNPSYSHQDHTDLGNWHEDPIAASMIYYPFFPAYHPDGSLALGVGQTLNMPADGSLQENPLAYTQIKDDRFRFRLFGKAALAWEILPGLTFQTLLGGDYRNFFFDFYKASTLGEYRAVAPVPAIARETNGRVVSYLSENTLTYQRAWGAHHLNLFAGYTYQREDGNRSQLTGSNLQDDLLPNIAGASQVTLLAHRYTWVQLSYLGRIQYAWQERYQFTAAFRRDGSSRFGPRAKWGLFPSVSAGWIVSEESFFPAHRAWTFAKLRLSWGQTGNHQIGAYSSQALLTPSNYVWGNNLAPGFIPATSPNPGLSWETNTAWNLGLDLGFFDRVQLAANYYHSVSSDLLLNVPVPQQSGYSSSLQNLGEVLNEGLEFETRVQGLQWGRLRGSVAANLATNRNEVLSLAEGQEEIRAGRDGAWRTKIGGPIADITAYHITGIFKTEEEIEATPSLAGTVTGDYMVEDVNGDGVIDDQDKVAWGTFAPELTYGLSGSLSFEDFDLSFTINGVEGRVAFFYDEAVITGSGEGFGVPSVYYMENRYHPENNPEGLLAQPNLGNYSAARRNTRVSSIYLQDADYLRLRAIQIGYSLSEDLLAKWKIKRLRFYASANNLLTFTRYRGYNPDSSVYEKDTDVLRAGHAQNNYPVAKSYLLGVNLGL